MIKTIVTCDRCKEDFQTHEGGMNQVRAQESSTTVSIAFGLTKIEYVDTCPACVDELQGLVRAFRGEPIGAVKKARKR